MRLVVPPSKPKSPLSSLSSTLQALMGPWSSHPLLMGQFDSLASEAATVKDLTNVHIKTFVESLVSFTDELNFDFRSIGSACKMCRGRRKKNRKRLRK